METAKTIFLIVFGIICVLWLVVDILVLIALAKSDAKPNPDPDEEITNIDL